MTDRAAEVRRVLDSYVVEIVEAYDLCPWAKPARLGGELSVEILWGQPGPEQWVAAGEAMLGRATTAVAMIVAPELAATPSQLRAIRDGVATRITTAGIAHFHPDSPFDLGSPARLVPALRGRQT